MKIKYICILRMNPERTVLCYLVKALRPLKSSPDEMIVHHAAVEERRLLKRLLTLNKQNCKSRERK